MKISKMVFAVLFSVVAISSVSYADACSEAGMGTLIESLTHTGYLNASNQHQCDVISADEYDKVSTAFASRCIARGGDNVIDHWQGELRRKTCVVSGSFYCCNSY